LHLADFEELGAIPEVDLLVVLDDLPPITGLPEERVSFPAGERFEGGGIHEVVFLAQWERERDGPRALDVERVEQIGQRPFDLVQGDGLGLWELRETNKRRVPL
jgi:hypothetical protein